MIVVTTIKSEEGQIVAFSQAADLREYYWTHDGPQYLRITTARFLHHWLIKPEDVLGITETFSGKPPNDKREIVIYHLEPEGMFP